MKRTFLTFLILGCWTFTSLAQQSPGKTYRNFPVLITLHFSSLSMPFKNMGANFSNIGIGVGTEVGFNDRGTWGQQAHVVYYFNKKAGNSLMLYSQSFWRPEVTDQLFTELKIGAGYALFYKPSTSFRQEKGEWLQDGRKGTGMFSLPIGIGFGYQNKSLKSYLAPYTGYQFSLLKGYSHDIPLVPHSDIQIGTRIHFEN